MARKSPSLPVLANVNEHLLQAAGVTRERLGALVRAAVEKTEAQLEATSTKAFCHDGMVVYSEPMTDHAIQAGAASRIIKTLLPHVREEQAAVKVLVVPAWAYGEDEATTIDGEVLSIGNNPDGRGEQGRAEQGSPPLPSLPPPSGGAQSLAKWDYIRLEAAPLPSTNLDGVSQSDHGGWGAKTRDSYGGVYEPPEHLGEIFPPTSLPESDDDVSAAQTDTPLDIDPLNNARP